jgi:hypothetical protein
MYDEIVKRAWYRRFYDNLPKWAKVLVMVLTILTLVWWVGLFIYKFLCLFRVIGEFIFDKRNYWTFLVCILILGIGSLLVAQFLLGLDPIGNVINWFIDRFNEIRLWIGGAISGN